MTCGWGAVAMIGVLNVIWFAVLGRSLLRDAAQSEALVPSYSTAAN